MNQHSLDAWYKLRDSGKLTERQNQVLEQIVYRGPMTGQEVAQIVPSGWKRLSELEAMGAIYRRGDRLCKVTGEQVTEWDIVSHQADNRQATFQFEQ